MKSTVASANHMDCDDLAYCNCVENFAGIPARRYAYVGNNLNCTAITDWHRNGS